jgi:hypothetical protein
VVSNISLSAKRYCSAIGVRRSVVVVKVYESENARRGAGLNRLVWVATGKASTYHVIVDAVRLTSDWS